MDDNYRFEIIDLLTPLLNLIFDIENDNFKGKDDSDIDFQFELIEMQISDVELKSAISSLDKLIKRIDKLIDSLTPKKEFCKLKFDQEIEIDELFYRSEDDVLKDFIVQEKEKWEIRNSRLKNIHERLTSHFEFFYTKNEISENTSKIEYDFSPKDLDFRKPWGGKFKIENIRNQRFFLEFEQKLFENKYIDKDYNFIGKKRKKHLAAIYSLLIEKNYFWFNGYNKINRSDVRMFLDHRYGVTTKEVFKPSKIESLGTLIVLDNNPWLNNLPNL